jgi:Bifunctional DNA primase/polymerase, N-terminal
MINNTTVVPAASRPEHWQESWHHLTLLRGTAERPRQPMWPKPDRLRASASKSMRWASAAYWGHTRPEVTVTETWGSLLATVAGGSDIGIIPWVTGMAVLDCDVKPYQENGRAWVPSSDGKSMRMAQPLVKKGIDDLAREVAKLGHSMDELATYTVRTKSGGYHLYYRQNPGLPLDANKHFREEWRVDLVCHQNSFVAAPPTAGYSVARDLPVAVMPLWLAEFLRDLNRNLWPQGGQRARDLGAASREARMGVKMAWKSDGVMPASLIDAYVQAETGLVAIASEHGGWNNAIFQCACNLMEIGYRHAQIEGAILEAAAPWGRKELTDARRTIMSACSHKSGAQCQCDLDESERP